MSLIVEDGTAKLDAESLVSVAFADDYFDKRGNVAWLDLDDSAKEAALRIATDYVEAFYSSRFRGFRTNPAQALSWPRAGVAKNNVGYSSDFSANPMRMLNSVNVGGFEAQSMASPYQQIAWQSNGLGTTLVALYKSDEIPPPVLKAVSELAWKATQGELVSDVGRTVEFEKVGEIEVRYDKNGPKTVRYPYIERMLDALLAVPSSGGGAMSRLVRV